MSYHARYCGLPPEALDFYSFSALRSTSPRDNGRPFHSDRERDTQSKDKIGTWPKRHMTKKYTEIPGLHVVAAIPNSQDHSYDLTLLRFNCCLSKMVSISAYTSKLMGKRQDSLCVSRVCMCVWYFTKYLVNKRHSTVVDITPLIQQKGKVLVNTGVRGLRFQAQWSELKRSCLHWLTLFFLCISPEGIAGSGNITPS